MGCSGGISKHLPCPQEVGDVLTDPGKGQGNTEGFGHVLQSNRAFSTIV
jgi:hypothetical protein